MEAHSFDGYGSPVKRARIESVRCMCIGARVAADGGAVAASGSSKTGIDSCR